MKTLLKMLETKRPAYSGSEAEFIETWIKPLGTIQDSAGNLYLRIGNAPILFSSHTDTVHRTEGRQRLSVQGNIVKLARREKTSNCLGADCTAGVWLMREMAIAKVPGLYIWHAAEEIGGVGSSHIAARLPKILDGILFAIAFDRRGTSSVITHQAGGRCCSDTFAMSLACQLGPDFVLDDGGIFTDTANYTDIIGECTNVSVGYYREHFKYESLDLAHLLKLREAMLEMDWEALAYERMPGEEDEDEKAYNDFFDWKPKRIENYSFYDSQCSVPSCPTCWNNKTVRRNKNVYECDFCGDVF